MTIDDIAARHVKAIDQGLKLAGYIARCDTESEAQRLSRGRHWMADFNDVVPPILAEITKLTAALADAEARGRLAAEFTTKQVADALQAAWDDWGADTQHFPDCFSIARGPKLSANFQISNFAWHVAIELNKSRALAQSPEDGKQEKV